MSSQEFQPGPGVEILSTVKVRLPCLIELMQGRWMSDEGVIYLSGRHQGKTYLERLRRETFANPQRYLSRKLMVLLREHRAWRNHKALQNRSPWRKRMGR